MDSKQELAFFTTEELIDEIARRSTTLCVGWIPLADSDAFSYRVSGPLLTSCGLVKAMQLELSRQLAMQMAQEG